MSTQPVGIHSATELLRLDLAAQAIIATLVRELDISEQEAEAAVGAARRGARGSGNAARPEHASLGTSVRRARQSRREASTSRRRGP